jgi:hypothetical protein
MILFDNIVQVLDLADFDRRLAIGIHCIQRGQIGAALDDGHSLRRTLLGSRVFKKRRAATLSRLALSRKLSVSPALSTAQ